VYVKASNLRRRGVDLPLRGHVTYDLDIPALNKIVTETTKERP
jgi:hypothetical protein